VQARSLRSIHIFSLGLCALSAQSIFVRELMSLVTGTELVVGALFAGWLFWVGAGGLFGGRLVRRWGTPSFRLFVGLAVLVAALLPVTTMCIRLGRGIIARPPGVLPPLGPSLAFSLAVIAPFGFLYGALYNVASDLWRGREGGAEAGISNVYIWEAAGSFFGALLFSFVLIVFFSQFEAAVIVAFVVIMSVSLYRPKGAVPYGRATLLFAAALAAGGLSPSLDRMSFQTIYPGYRIDRFYSSPYGEVVVASEHEVTSVFSGGGRLFSFPEPERTEEVIDIPLLLSPKPRAVLLIGGSLGGGWKEALKHRSVTALDCIELDGSFFGLGIGGGAPGGAAGARGGDREGFRFGPASVRFIATDGRFYLSAGTRRYDVIILDSPPPLNLQWNRFYTKEFFEIARGSLLPGGIFAFTHPASENFLSKEQAKVLRACELTLRDEFDSVQVLPGSTVHFIASDSPIEVDSMLARVAERHIDAPFVSAAYLPFRFSPDRIALLRSDLERVGNVPKNTDERPYLPLLELILEASRAGSSFARVFEKMLAWPAFAPAAILMTLVIVAFALSRGGAKARFAVWGVGFASFLFQLLVLLAYQSFSGLLYRAIVLLSALFMAGVALGAIVSMRHDVWGSARLWLIHGCFASLAAVLAAWTAVLLHAHLSYVAGSAGFAFCACCGGFLTGSYYPIVVRTAYRDDEGAVPATFYAWDLFGACLGGITGGIIFFPCIGIVGTVACIVLVHAFVAGFLVGRW
jgi:spermidine synthase